MIQEMKRSVDDSKSSSTCCEVEGVNRREYTDLRIEGYCGSIEGYWMMNPSKTRDIVDIRDPTEVPLDDGSEQDKKYCGSKRPN